MRTATILLIGESKAGKDTLINVLSKGKFTYRTRSTSMGKIRRIILNKHHKLVIDKLDTMFPKNSPLLYYAKCMTDVGTIYVGRQIPLLKIDVVNFINTSGKNIEDTEKWIDMEYKRSFLKKIIYDKIIYVFDASKFYTDKNIKLGIQYTIDECKDKIDHKKCKIKYLALGTRASEVKDKEKLEYEVQSMGIECRIFELKDIPIDKIADFIFID